MSSILQKQINLKQTGPGIYSASWHSDWTLGNTLHGGCIAAIVHHAAATYLTTSPDLKVYNQPDVLKLHIEFLRACDKADSTIQITPMKLGAANSILQLELSQNGLTRIFALITTTNFDKSLGPTVATAWSLLPPPTRPTPDFDRVAAHQRDLNWVPAILSGEIIPFTRRMLVLDPYGGFPVDGVCDAWNGFLDDERIDATYLALMADTLPSMSDTLLRNGGLYDAHAFYKKAERWSKEKPGVPAQITNSIAEAMKASTHNATISMDVEFKRRIPKEGLRFVFVRTATKMLQDGRMDIDVTICDEEMGLVCHSRHLDLVLEAQRKFRTAKKGPVL
ncbi:hypothetical protein E8E14_009996 [Neopestalotiopsis sp. 37M]|nr:hypothetical protein E8E14_009996 [Neopestalotiopsis sp. 37M]